MEEEASSASHTEHDECAALTEDGYGFEPARGQHCVMDTQVWALHRFVKASITAGGVVYGGQTSNRGGGALFGLHLLELPGHSVSLGAGVGPVWLAVTLAYTLSISDRFHIFLAPEFRGADAREFRIGGGLRYGLTSFLAGVVEMGWTHRAQVDAHYRYQTLHAGLALVLTVGKSMRAHAEEGSRVALLP